MKVWVIGKKGFFGGLLCLVLLFFLAGTAGIHTVRQAAASGERELPIYCVETKDRAKQVALGINCAWGDGDILSILDTLDQHQVKATFFLVGSWCDAHPKSVKLIAQRGHEIGSHSDTHPDMPSLSEEQMIQEITESSRKIAQLTGSEPKLFRCPSGSYDNRTIQVIRQQGYYPIQWSLDSLDWKGTDEQQMKERILPKLTYGDILLFHNDTDHTAQALPGIIDAIQKKGYEFVPVGDMIYQGEYRVDLTGRQFPG